jgi:NADPH-dependent 2,4-dienoyl-CoA reductase/sulfur reductase-like enzyme
VKKLVVIGGDAAGMSAASQARKRLGVDSLQIVAFERGHFTSYSACGIPYWIGGVVTERDVLVARTPGDFAKLDIEVRTRHEVVGIDLDRREVVVHDLESGGREVREPFDHLVYAAGAVPVTPDWARVDAGGVFGVQTLDDGTAIHDWLDRTPTPRTAVVVGGGYIGVEMAEALVRRGLDVTLVEKSPQPMSSVDPDMGEKVREAICGLGIEVRTGVTVEGLDTADGRVRAVVTDDGALPADIVVLGLGVRPNTALAADAGIAPGVTGGLRTDLRMRVVGDSGTVDGVWAAGDCTETLHLVSGRPVHVPLGTHANKQGRVAGINIGGGYATFPGVIGTAVTKVCDLEVARTGMTEKEATVAGYAFVTASVESSNRAGYYPDARTMVVKLIAEKRTGLLLGAQIVGREDAAKRIDGFAVALWNRMTVEEMTALDLSYAPPFSPVWDPVLIAARKATEGVHAAG